MPRVASRFGVGVNVAGALPLKSQEPSEAWTVPLREMPLTVLVDRGARSRSAMLEMAIYCSSKTAPTRS